jgi:hypothetical protein
MYKGSGVDWLAHLEKYGEDHDTEILRVCESKDELRTYGLYYSALWNVVSSVDDYGNKIWANKIPENGSGGMTSETATEVQNRPEIKKMKMGKNNPYHRSNKEKHSKATSEAMNREEVKKKISGENSHHYDHTIYKFIHDDDTAIDCTFFELRKLYKLHHGHLRSVIKGERATHKGWRVK